MLRQMHPETEIGVLREERCRGNGADGAQSVGKHMRKMLCRQRIVNVFLQDASTGDVTEQCACGVIGQCGSQPALAAALRWE